MVGKRQPYHPREQSEEGRRHQGKRMEKGAMREMGCDTQIEAKAGEYNEAEQSQDVCGDVISKGGRE